MDPLDHNCVAYHETSKFEVPEPEPIELPITQQTIPEERKTQKNILNPKKNKTNIALMLVIFSLLSVVSLYYINGNRGIEAVQPLETDYELHSIALGQVNVLRYRNDLEDLSYSDISIAQEWAWKLMKEGNLQHNPELPSDMGENIAVHTENGIDPKIAVALMVEEMVNNDAKFNYANRANILNPVYTKLAVGVAVEDDTVYLVLCFN